MELLRTLLYGVSAQRPAHTLFIGGEALPVETRLGGLFLGFFVGLLLLRFLGRWQAARGPHPLVELACWLAILVMALDGLNATLFDRGLWHAYEPQNWLRLATGLLAGYGLALLALPVVASVIWQSPSDDPSVTDGVEEGSGVALLGLLGALMLADVGPLLWPFALLLGVAVLADFVVLNLYLLALAANRVASLGGEDVLRASPVAAIGLALVELVLLAGVRSAMAGFGVVW